MVKKQTSSGYFTCSVLMLLVRHVQAASGNTGLAREPLDGLA